MATQKNNKDLSHFLSSNSQRYVPNLTYHASQTAGMARRTSTFHNIALFVRCITYKYMYYLELSNESSQYTTAHLRKAYGLVFILHRSESNNVYASED